MNNNGQANFNGGDNQLGSNTIESLKAQQMGQSPAPQKKSLLRRIMIALGVAFIGFFTLGLIGLLLMKPIELTGSKEFKNSGSDPFFTITLPSQFSENEVLRDEVVINYSYVTPKNDEDKSEFIAAVIIEDIGSFVEFYDLQPRQTVEEFLYDFYLNQDAGRLALAGLIDFTLDLDDVEIVNVSEGSADNIERLLLLEFTAETDSGDADIKGAYWFTLENDGSTGYNLMIAGVEESWDANEEVINNVVDSFKVGLENQIVDGFEL